MVSLAVVCSALMMFATQGAPERDAEAAYRAKRRPPAGTPMRT